MYPVPCSLQWTRNALWDLKVASCWEWNSKRKLWFQISSKLRVGRMEGISLLCNLLLQPHAPLLASPRTLPLPNEKWKTSAFTQSLRLFFKMPRVCILGVEFGSGKIGSKESTLIYWFKIASESYVVKSSYRNPWHSIPQQWIKKCCTKNTEFNSIDRFSKGLQKYFQLFLWWPCIFMTFCTSGCAWLIPRSFYQQQQKIETN